MAQICICICVFTCIIKGVIKGFSRQVDSVGLIYSSDLLLQKPLCLPTGIIPPPSKLFVNINMNNTTSCSGSSQQIALPFHYFLIIFKLDKLFDKQIRIRSKCLLQSPQPGYLYVLATYNCREHFMPTWMIPNKPSPSKVFVDIDVDRYIKVSQALSAVLSCCICVDF